MNSTNVCVQEGAGLGRQRRAAGAGAHGTAGTARRLAGDAAARRGGSPPDARGRDTAAARRQPAAPGRVADGRPAAETLHRLVLPDHRKALSTGNDVDDTFPHT